MGEFYGADVAQLRALAKSLDRAGENLASLEREITGDVMAARAWKGPAADDFRRSWTARHRPSLAAASTGLDDAAHRLALNADAQDRTSNTYERVGDLAHPALWGPFAPDSGLGVLHAVHGTISDGKKFVTKSVTMAKWATAFRGLQAAAGLDDAARLAATANVYKAVGGLHGYTAGALGVAEEFGRLGKLGPVFGGLGGVASIIGGVNQMFNTQYDGARGVVDRVMGGVSVVGGAGSIAIALGGAALLGPVGVGIVVGAGVVAGAWALGNAIYDNWDAISAFKDDAVGVVTDAFGEAVDLAGDAAGAVKDVAGDVAGAAKDGLKKAGDFIGGLFS